MAMFALRCFHLIDILVEVAVFLECHVLDHRRQLVVVAEQDHSLEPTAGFGVRSLKQHPARRIHTHG